MERITFCSETFNFSFMFSIIDGFGSNLTSMLYFYFSYRGGVDSEGRPVMVVVGAHFLLRCLDLERFVLYVVKVIRVWLLRCLDHQLQFFSSSMLENAY
jgi:hypothetical protein